MKGGDSLYDPYECLGLHCSLTHRAFTAIFENRLKGTGISPAQFSALAYLMALGPLTQSELAERLSITAPTAVRLVDRMERDKWVIRQTAPDDGRVKRVTPTRQACRIWKEMSLTVGRDVIDQAYRGVHPAELETVKRVLSHVRRNLLE